MRWEVDYNLKPVRGDLPAKIFPERAMWHSKSHIQNETVDRLSPDTISNCLIAEN